jgi:hypothetical protein
MSKCIKNLGWTVTSMINIALWCCVYVPEKFDCNSVKSSRKVDKRLPKRIDNLVSPRIFITLDSKMIEIECAARFSNDCRNNGIAYPYFMLFFGIENGHSSILQESRQGNIEARLPSFFYLSRKLCSISSALKEKPR